MQYFHLYALRFANLTNLPTEGSTLYGTFTTMPRDNASITLQGRYQDEKNDETSVSDYESDSAQLAATLWWAPSPRLYAVASAQVLHQEQETHICIPLMDG